MQHRLHELHRDHPNRITVKDLAEFLLFFYEVSMNKLDQLQAAVQAEDTVIQSAVTLLQGIAQRIADAGVDPDALAALVADINTQTSTLASAVAAVPGDGS